MGASSRRSADSPVRVLSFYRAPGARDLAIDRYSRRVALLKRMLPAVGIALLLLVATWPRLLPLLRSGPGAVPTIDLRQARELTMIDARFAGVDRQGRPYVVTAAVARQLPSNKDLLALEQPRAELTVRPGTRITMTAASGIYQSAVALLDLFGGVELIREDGTHFRTRRAHLDLSAKTARGGDPVEGRGPAGKIAGQGFRIFDKGNTILFAGKAKAVLNGGRTGAGTSPASLPPAVAWKAALLETAALAQLRPQGVPTPAAARRLGADELPRSAPRPSAREHLLGAQPAQNAFAG
jgi:lipopolysaccharide export system protein LptC